MKRGVLITRPMDDALALGERVRGMGGTPLIAPMLEIEAVLESPLPDPRAYNALIFTSRHAATRFASLSQERDVPAIAVGSSTAEKLKTLGFQIVFDAGGSADAIPHFVAVEGIRHVLYLRGEDVKVPLPAILAKEGVNCIDSVLYRARKLESIPENVWEAMEEGQVACAVFYSQRTAENFIRIVAERGRTDALKSIIALCLSDSVVKSVQQKLWKRTLSAEQPREECLLRLLEECMSEDHC